MANLVRQPFRAITKSASPFELSQLARSAPRWPQHSLASRRSLASVVPPVTQDSTGKQGPTAIVFMNMGGPSTVDEVGDFLSRLFVCIPLVIDVWVSF